MNPEEVKQAVADGVKQAMDEHPLFVPREQHFQDHVFVKGVRESVSEARKTGIRVIIGSIVVALMTGLVLLFKKSGP